MHETSPGGETITQAGFAMHEQAVHETAEQAVEELQATVQGAESTAENAAVQQTAEASGIDHEFTDATVNRAEAEQQTFKYIHTDGKEFSGTVEQARKVCPVLGKMSVENAERTMRQSDLAARIAERGRQKREADTAAKTEASVRAARQTSEKTDVSSHKTPKPETPAPPHPEVSSAPATATPQVQEKVPAPTPIAERSDSSVSESEAAAKISMHIHEQLKQTTENSQNTEAPSYESSRTEHPAAAPLEQEPAAIHPRQRPESDHGATEAYRAAEAIHRLRMEQAAAEAHHPYAADTQTAATATEKGRAESSVPVSDGIAAEAGNSTRSSPEIQTELPEAEATEDAITDATDAEAVPVEPDDPRRPELTMEIPDPESLPDISALENLPADAVISDESGLPYDLDSSTEVSDHSSAVAETAPFTEAHTTGAAATNLPHEVSLPLTHAAVKTEFNHETNQQPARVPELPAATEEIESVIARLHEALEDTDASKEQAVHAAVEQIIRLPEHTEAGLEATHKLDHQLKELFVELFEAAGIGYSPELVDSFVQLTRTHYLEELWQALEEQGDDETLPDEIGTREFLQKLRQSMSQFQKKLRHFDEIGKSALHLYSQQLALADAA